ncbi:hypothetical protein GCM10017044_27500 [Kordiimonas sediminis]|uniref:Rod shape-determining protein MreD n=1 Tax=Kordiimonas sediminis TaxID=1735581 RepID=A0A919EAN8_9PROT|nr:rod shape-determining protein MreD [Kordiimonas sediminis]GHF30618.1 hypothetical protein GCM10017044_27500 [Kordiimonas sediminis]
MKNLRPNMTRFGLPGFIPLLITLLMAIIMLLPIGTGAANVTMPHLVLISVFYYMSYRPLLLPYGACAFVGFMLDLWLDVPLGMNMAMLVLTRFFVLNQLKHYRGKSAVFQWGTFGLLTVVLYTMSWALMSMINREMWPVVPHLTQWLVTLFAYAPVALLLGRFRKAFL